MNEYSNALFDTSSIKFGKLTKYKYKITHSLILGLLVIVRFGAGGVAADFSEGAFDGGVRELPRDIPFAANHSDQLDRSPHIVDVCGS